jgi:hypothetical protein
MTVVGISATIRLSLREHILRKDRLGVRVSGTLPGSGVLSAKTSAAGCARGAHQTFSAL